MGGSGEAWTEERDVVRVLVRTLGARHAHTRVPTFGVDGQVRTDHPVVLAPAGRVQGSEHVLELEDGPSGSSRPGRLDPGWWDGRDPPEWQVTTGSIDGRSWWSPAGGSGQYAAFSGILNRSTSTRCRGLSATRGQVSAGTQGPRCILMPWTSVHPPRVPTGRGSGRGSGRRDGWSD